MVEHRAQWSVALFAAHCRSVLYAPCWEGGGGGKDDAQPPHEAEGASSLHTTGAQCGLGGRRGAGRAECGGGGAREREQAAPPHEVDGAAEPMQAFYTPDDMALSPSVLVPIPDALCRVIYGRGHAMLANKVPPPAPRPAGASSVLGERARVAWARGLGVRA